MPRPIAQTLLVLAALAASAAAAAGTASGTFGVNIVLSQPGAVGPVGAAPGSASGSSSGTCISDSLSEATGALVRVVCASGQFVSIGHRPGRRFVGSHGGAYNGYYFGTGFGSLYRTEYSPSGVGAGTITSFRVYSIREADGPLDLLVSF